MTQTFERAKSRLNNIQAINPLLGALRTISMSTWQMALNKIAKTKQYEDHLNSILFEILPQIDLSDIRKSKQLRHKTEIADTIILIVGTERGLCGNFNKSLINNALSWIKAQDFVSHKVWGLGSRLIRDLGRMDIDLAWRNPLPASELTSYQEAYQTTQNWLEQFESYAFNKFIILYNQKITGSPYQFSIFNLLPYEIHHPESAKGDPEDIYPPPIIETDPKGIYHQIIEHYIATSFYQILLRSAAAEHSSRYNLMQEAEENAEDIIEELQQVINAERKRQITQEMQELASGAGLLGN